MSQEYLDGLGSYNYLATKYNIGCKTLKEWVAKYRIHGIGAFIRKTGNASYSSDFKTMCVEAVLSGDGSVDDIAAKYNISSRRVLSQWVVSYNANRELKDYVPKREVYMAEARRKQPLLNAKKSLSIVLNITMIIKGLQAFITFHTARFIPG